MRNILTLSISQTQKMILFASFLDTLKNGITKQFLSITSGSTTVPTPNTQTSNF